MQRLNLSWSYLLSWFWATNSVNSENTIWRAVIYSQWGSGGISKVGILVMVSKFSPKYFSRVHVATIDCWRYFLRSYQVYYARKFKSPSRIPIIFDMHVHDIRYASSRAVTQVYSLTRQWILCALNCTNFKCFGLQHKFNWKDFKQYLILGRKLG